MNITDVAAVVGWFEKQVSPLQRVAVVVRPQWWSGGEVIGVKLVVVGGESGLLADRLLNRV